MNKTQSNHSSSSSSFPHGGFTLVEILVVVGIIVLLVSILIPMISRASKQSMRLRTQADFQSIAMALEAYKEDFGDIPRPPTTQPNTGAATLGKALLGPYGALPASVPAFSNTTPIKAGDCVSDTGGYVALVDNPGPTLTDTTKWAPFAAYDGADGPGFKTRVGTAKTYGPYLASGKVKSRGVFLLDSNSNPILYFPAKLGRTDPTRISLPGYVDRYVLGVPPNPTSLYNADDNFEAFRHAGESVSDDLIVLYRIRIMLGDYNANGYIEPGASETAVNQPYLLWSPGPDDNYGPLGYAPSQTQPDANRKAVDQCDDILNK